MLDSIKKFLTAKQPEPQAVGITYSIVRRIKVDTGEFYYVVEQNDNTPYSRWDNIKHVSFNHWLGAKAFASIQQCEAAITEYKMRSERADYRAVIKTGL